jgi:hypothetical protein
VATPEELTAILVNPEVSVDGLRIGDDNGAEVFDGVAEMLRRYVACGSAAIVAAVLWIVHTWAFEAADCSPRFVLLSAEPQSGKTRFLEVLKLLVRDPLFAVNISDAALFRVIEARRPTVLHDEIDAVFGPKARDREDLRAMLNAGYERGATVQRCVGDGSRQRVESFPVFTPVAMAGLGKLPETIEQRSIVVRMKRRTPDETVAKLRRREVKPEAEAVRRRLEAWARLNIASLATAEPEIPDELDDRAGDIWEPLLAIADAAGGDWPERARDAARTLFGARRADEETIGVRLLRDIRAVFEDDQALASGDLAAKLATLEGAPWAEWSGRDRDRPISPHGVAKLLRRYDIAPGNHWFGATCVRGYLRADFEDAWSRFLHPPQSARSRELLGAMPSNGNGPSTPSSLALCAKGNEHAVDGWDEAQALAKLDPDDPDHGINVARIRAEAARRRKQRQGDSAKHLDVDEDVA